MRDRFDVLFEAERDLRAARYAELARLHERHAVALIELSADTQRTVATPAFAARVYRDQLAVLERARECRALARQLVGYEA